MDINSLGGQLLDRSFQWVQAKQDNDSKIRMLYLECLRNLGLLDCLNLESPKASKSNDPDFIAVAKLIDVGIIELVFAEGKRNHLLFKSLSKTVSVNLDNTEQEDDKDPKTLLEALLYLYKKSFVLSKLIAVEKKGNALKRINFRVRLHNFRAALLCVVKKLETFDEVKILSQ